MTIDKLIKSVRRGKIKQIPLSEISDVASIRTKAVSINKILLAQGIKTKDGKPPYTISKNARTGFLYIINNIIEG